MSVVANDLVLYASAAMPNDDTSLNGGAIDLAEGTLYIRVFKLV